MFGGDGGTGEAPTMRWFHVTGSGSYAYATTGGRATAPDGVSVPSKPGPGLFSMIEPCPSEDGCLLSLKITALYADGGAPRIRLVWESGTDTNGPPSTGDGVLILEYE